MASVFGLFQGFVSFGRITTESAVKIIHASLFAKDNAMTPEDIKKQYDYLDKLHISGWLHECWGLAT
jgi:hypothetical protein